jgi:hypothetical protein
VNPFSHQLDPLARVSLAFFFVAVPVVVAIWDYYGFLVCRDGLYFAVGGCGITVLFMCTAGHCSFLNVKVTCTDFVALMLLRHFFSQAPSSSR